MVVQALPLLLIRWIIETQWGTKWTGEDHLVGNERHPPALSVSLSLCSRWCREAKSRDVIQLKQQRFLAVHLTSCNNYYHSPVSCGPPHLVVFLTWPPDGWSPGRVASPKRSQGVNYMQLTWMDGWTGGEVQTVTTLFCFSPVLSICQMLSESLFPILTIHQSHGIKANIRWSEETD